MVLPKLTLEEYNAVPPGPGKTAAFNRLSDLDQDRAVMQYKEEVPSEGSAKTGETGGQAEIGGQQTQGIPVRDAGRAGTPEAPAEASIQVIEPLDENRIVGMVERLKAAGTAQEKQAIVEGITGEEAKEVLRRAQGIPKADVSKLSKEEVGEVSAYAKEGRSLGGRQYEGGALPEVERKQRGIILNKNEELDKLGPELEKQIDGIKYGGAQEGIARPGKAVQPTMTFRDEFTGSNVNVTKEGGLEELKKRIQEVRQADPEAVSKSIAAQVGGLTYVGKKQRIGQVTGAGRYNTEDTYQYKTDDGTEVTINTGDTVEKIKQYLESKKGAVNEKAGQKTEALLKQPEPPTATAPTPEIIDEETYLATHGASRQDIGEAALHKNRGGKSDKAWKKIVDEQAKKDHELIIKRAMLREEYRKKVDSGEVKPPSRFETLWNTAQGNEENVAVQAARRILERKGYDWKIPLEGQAKSDVPSEQTVTATQPEVAPPATPKLQTRVSDVILNRYIKKGATEGKTAQELHNNVIQLLDRALPIDIAEASGITEDEAKAAVADIKAGKTSDVATKVRTAIAPRLLYNQTVDEVYKEITEPRDASGKIMFSKKEPKKSVLEQLLTPKEDYEGIKISDEPAKGFMLPDGRYLGVAGVSDEHRVINGLVDFGKDDEGYEHNRTAKMYRIMEEAEVVRFIPESNAFQLKSEPTRQQVRAIERYIKENGSAEVEFKNRKSNTYTEDNLYEFEEDIERGGVMFSKKERPSTRKPTEAYTSSPEEEKLTKAVYRDKTPTPGVIRIVEPNAEQQALKDAFEEEYPGKEVVWIDINEKQLMRDVGESYNGFMFRGATDPALKNKIFVNVNTDKPALQIAYHELTHFIQQNPELNAAFWDAAKLTTKGKELVARRGRDEVMADIAGEMMADPEFQKALHDQNKSAFRAIYEKLIEILDRITKALTGRKDAKRYTQYVEDVEGLRDTMKGILREYGGEQATGEQRMAASRRFKWGPEAEKEIDALDKRMYDIQQGVFKRMKVAYNEDWMDSLTPEESDEWRELSYKIKKLQGMPTSYILKNEAQQIMEAGQRRLGGDDLLTSWRTKLSQKEKDRLDEIQRELSATTVDYDDPEVPDQLKQRFQEDLYKSVQKQPGFKKWVEIPEHLKVGMDAITRTIQAQYDENEIENITSGEKRIESNEIEELNTPKTALVYSPEFAYEILPMKYRFGIGSWFVVGKKVGSKDTPYVVRYKRPLDLSYKMSIDVVEKLVDDLPKGSDWAKFKGKRDRLEGVFNAYYDALVNPKQPNEIEIEARSSSIEETEAMMSRESQIRQQAYNPNIMFLASIGEEIGDGNVVESLKEMGIDSILINGKNYDYIMPIEDIFGNYNVANLYGDWKKEAPIVKERDVLHGDTRKKVTIKGEPDWNNIKTKIQYDEPVQKEEIYLYGDKFTAENPKDTGGWKYSYNVDNATEAASWAEKNKNNSYWRKFLDTKETRDLFDSYNGEIDKKVLDELEIIKEKEAIPKTVIEFYYDGSYHKTTVPGKVNDADAKEAAKKEWIDRRGNKDREEYQYQKRRDKYEGEKNAREVDKKIIDAVGGYPDIRYSKKSGEGQPMFSKKGDLEKELGIPQSPNTTYYKIGDTIERKKELRKRLGKLKDENLDERIKIEEDIKRLDNFNREFLAKSIINYAQRIGLRAEPYNRVDTLVKNARTANDFKRAVEVMDMVLEKRVGQKYFKAAEKAIENAYIYLTKIEGKTRPTTDINTNRAIKEYLDSITGGDEETKRKAKAMAVYYTQHGTDEVKRNRDKYIEELGSDVIEWIEEGKEEVPASVQRLVKSLASTGLEGKTNRQLLSIINNLRALRTTGRTVKMIEEQKEKARINNAANKISEAVIRNTKEAKKTPIQKAVGSVQESEKRRRLGFLKNAGNIIYSALDTETILERIAGTRGDSTLKREVFDPAYRATVAEKKGIKETLQKFRERYKDVDIRQANHDAFMDIEIEAYDKNGDIVKELKPLTFNEGMYFYAMSMNDSQREALIWTLVRPAQEKDFPNRDAFKEQREDINDAKRKIAEAVIDTVVNALPENYKQHVREQWKYYKDEQYQKINPEYSRVHGIDMPQEDFYFPIRRNAEYIGNSVDFDLMERLGYRQAKVDGRFTKSRMSSRSPLKNFDYFGTVIDNMLQVEHYAAFNAPINNIRRVLNQVDVRESIKNFNPEAWNKINDWIKSLAYGRVDYGSFDDTLSKTIKTIRQNSAIFQLGFKAVSIMIQSGSYFRGMSGVGFKNAVKVWGELAKAIYQGKGVEFFKEIDNLSPIMEAREGDSEQILQEWFESGIADKILKTEKAGQKLRSIAMKPMSAYDKFLAAMIWKAKFNEVISKGDFANEQEATGKAVYEADKVVRRTQSGGGLLASTAMHRGPEWQRIYTQFASDSIKGFNMLTGFFDHFKEMAPGEKIAIIAYGFILPAIIANLVRSGFRPPWDEPEEVVQETVRSFSDGLPIFGTIFDVAATVGTDWMKRLRGKPQDTWYDMITSVSAPVFGPITDITEGIKEGALDEKWWKLVRGVGAITGIPGGAQLTRIVKEGKISLEGGNKMRLIAGARADREYELVRKYFRKDPTQGKDPEATQRYTKWAEKQYASWSAEKKKDYRKYVIAKRKEKLPETLVREEGEQEELIKRYQDEENTTAVKIEQGILTEMRKANAPVKEKYFEEEKKKPYPKDFAIIYELDTSKKRIDNARARIRLKKLTPGQERLYTKYRQEQAALAAK
ncbi:MAG: hypothetical protein WC315_07050 [Candidatus Omnitrophota bacterium]